LTVLDAAVRELEALGISCSREVPPDDPDFRIDVKYQGRTIPLVLAWWGLDEDWWALWFQTAEALPVTEVAGALERAVRSVAGVGEVRVYASFRELEDALLGPWRERSKPS
jgi:hypothetical protein